MNSTIFVCIFSRVLEKSPSKEAGNIHACSGLITLCHVREGMGACVPMEGPSLNAGTFYLRRM